MTPKITYPNGKTPRVCIIGAGYSGLCAAIQLKKQLDLTTFTLFESNPDVGGTWLSNTYPGCACDIQSHLYSFSFEPNPNWSTHYSPQPEIWDYMKNVAQKYKLYPQMRFNRTVKSLTWQDDKKKWTVVSADKAANNNEEEIEQFDIVISAVGALRAPNYPKEYANFKGTIIHSAEWNSDVDLENKVVAVIGSGASAIQVIPSIAEKVKELHVYQRKAPYVNPRVQFEYPKWIQTLFYYVPFLMVLFRSFIFVFNDIFIILFKAGSSFNSMIQRRNLKNLKKVVQDPKLEKELTPNYKLGCKRILKSSDYYPAMTLPHVSLHTSKIVEVNANSIRTEDGKVQKADVLILCTGFLVQDFFAPMQIIGKNSVDLYKQWQTEGPATFYGITSTGVPNLFFLLGPNTGLGHNSVVFMIECQVNFVINILKEMMHRNADSVDTKLSAQQECMDAIRSNMKKTIWGTDKCASWYANDAGEITALWPQSCTTYWRKTKNVEMSHFSFN